MCHVICQHGDDGLLLFLAVAISLQLPGREFGEPREARLHDHPEGLLQVRLGEDVR